jgi:hypothetical protein
LLTGSVGEPGVSAGHLDILMPQKLLETFETHPRVEKLGGKRVAKTMDRVAFLIEPCLLEVFHEEVSAGTVTKVPMAQAVKDELLVLVPSPKPEFDGKERIVAQVDHPPHAILLSLEKMNLPALDVQIV